MARPRLTWAKAEARFSPNDGFLLDVATRQKYDLPDGYVLYLGGFDWRKNLRGLFAAWSWAAASGSPCS